MIHGSSVYFKDLSTELKIKSTESLYKYLGAPDEVDKMDNLAPDCECDREFMKIPNYNSMSTFVFAFHDLISDHKPVQRCIICGIVIFESLLTIHLKHDCNDDLAS